MEIEMAWFTFAFAMIYVASIGVAFYMRTYGGVVAVGVFMMGAWISFTGYGFPIEGRLPLTVASVLIFLVCLRKKVIDTRKAKSAKTLQLEGGVVPHTFNKG